MTQDIFGPTGLGHLATSAPWWTLIKLGSKLCTIHSSCGVTFTVGLGLISFISLWAKFCRNVCTKFLIHSSQSRSQAYCVAFPVAMVLQVLIFVCFCYIRGAHRDQVWFLSRAVYAYHKPLRTVVTMITKPIGKRGIWRAVDSKPLKILLLKS